MLPLTIGNATKCQNVRDGAASFVALFPLMQGNATFSNIITKKKKITTANLRTGHKRCPENVLIDRAINITLLCFLSFYLLIFLLSSNFFYFVFVTFVLFFEMVQYSNPKHATRDLDLDRIDR